MSNRLVRIVAGLCLATSSLGCCCMGGGGWGANRCAPCNSGCSPSFYQPQQGAMMQGADASAFMPSSTVAINPYATYPQTAVIPTQQIPTY